MATAQVVHRQLHEEECVARWRYSRLREAGYGEHAAATLARRSDIELHLAVGLVENGCPVATALEILV